MSQKAERQGEEELKDRQRQLQIGGRGSVVLSRRENMDLTNFIGPCRYTESAQARGHEGRDERLGYRPIVQLSTEFFIIYFFRMYIYNHLDILQNYTSTCHLKWGKRR